MNHKPEKEDQKQKKHSLLQRMLDFDIKLKSRHISKIVPFIIFLTALAVIYIAHKYWAQKSMIELTRLNREIKDLRIEYVDLKADYTNKTKLSEIQKRSEQLGLKILTEPQKKLIINKNEH
jgi:cell division protein FtsL